MSVLQAKKKMKNLGLKHKKELPKDITNMGS